MPAALHAQASAPPKVPDILVFINGEQLTGELQTATSTGITFKSVMAGDISVPWAKIKALNSSKSFALLTKNQKVTRRDASQLVPKGQVTVDDKQIVVTGAAGTRAVPTADAALLVDLKDFDKAVNHPPDLLHGWAGAVTAGATLVRATQDSTTFNGAINLVRANPQVAWLPARDRTTITYSQSYGTVSQIGTPSVKTNIFHAMGERDQYFSPRVFAFGSATFDHNFSQSLLLQQAYGGGAGITLLKNPHRTLDFKGDIHYEQEAFVIPTTNVSLAGSTFSETYVEHLVKGLVLNQFGSFSPSWNHTSDYSAHVNANLVFPVYKGFAFNIGAVDDFLNNAPAGSNKNSSQFTTGITYAIRPR